MLCLSYFIICMYVRLFLTSAHIACVTYFKMQITEETFQTLLDRVATTKDFSTVRDNIIFFLQVSSTTSHHITSQAITSYHRIDSNVHVMRIFSFINSSGKF